MSSFGGVYGLVNSNNPNSKLTSCIVPECHDKTSSRHRFPSGNDIYNNWLRQINNPKLFSLPKEKVCYSYRVCGRHFEADCFIPNVRKHILKKGSVPTLFVASSTSELENNSIDLPVVSQGLGDLHLISSEDIVSNLYSVDLDTQNIILPTLCEPKNQLEKDSNIINTSVNSKIDQDNISTEDESVSIELNFDDSQLEPQDEIYINDNMSEIIQIEVENSTCEKPFFKSVKSYLVDNHSLTEVCRVCFCSIVSKDMIKFYDEEQKENMEKVKKMINFVLPDLDLEIYPNIVICVKCMELLLYSHELKEKWLTTEMKLKNIIENRKDLTKRDADLIIVAKAGNEKDNYKKKRSESGIVTKQVLQEILTYNERKVDYEEKSEIYENFKPDTDLINRKVDRKNKNEWCLSPHMCDRCGILITNLTSFKSHLKKHDKDKIDKPQLNSTEVTEQECIICEQCGIIFTNLPAFKQHLPKHKVKHECNLCGKIFKYHGLLKAHIRNRHLKLYNYCQCHLCGKQLAYKKSLPLHLLSHNPKKVYLCQICDKKFISPHVLRRHLRKHDSTKLECEYCGRKIKYECYLKKHIRIYHKNEADFICDVCNRPYWKQVDLIKHKIKIHGNS